MKKRLFNFCLLLSTAAISFAQQPSLKYTIAPWANNKKAAVSLTFDDGISGQFTVALPLLNEHHFKATFFVTPKILLSQLNDWQLVQAAAAQGHEIANHSLTHPHFNAITADTIAQELIQSNAFIEENTKQKSQTHAYPFGEGGLETMAGQAARNVVKKYFIGARATRNKNITYNEYDFAVSDDDYFKVNSDVIADSAAMANFETQLDATIAAGGWYVPTYHGIVNGWIVVPQNIFEKHLNELEKRKDDFWIAPFSNVLKYHKERNCAKLVALSENKHSLVLTLTDTLNNDATWNEPLTINLKISGKKIKAIHQANSTLPFTVSGDDLIFNAIPGKDKIMISKD